MRLHICWGTCPVPGGHPCRIAYEALERAGHDPEVIKAYGARLLPDYLNGTEGGGGPKGLIEKRSVPVLVTEDGEVVSETDNIVAWAARNPASAGTASSA